MEQTYVFYNGKILPEEDVRISVRSKAFNYGLGVFEGIRAYWNDEEQQLYGFKMIEHYERFLESCKCLNIDMKYSAQELADYTVELLKKHNWKCNTYIRPIAYKDGRNVGVSIREHDHDCVVIYLQKMDKYMKQEEFRVGVVSWTRIADNMLPPRTKATAGYVNSALANLEAVRAGFDEAVILNRHGNVCEGPGENIFIIKNNKLITPPVSDDILEGVTRKIIMELCANKLGMEVVERSIARTELYNSQEVFYSGTAMEVAPIVEVDHRQVGDGKPGKITMELKRMFNLLSRGKMEEYKSSLTPVYEK